MADPLRDRLEATGVCACPPDVLAGADRADDDSPAATPVADPPYVTATSRDPVLCATVSGGSG